MSNRVRINPRGVRQLTREIQKELTKNPVFVPVEARATTVFPSPTTVTNYNGPVINVTGDHTQIAWGNDNVNQAQSQYQDVTAGYEDVAKLLTSLLAAVPNLGLSAVDNADLEESAIAVLEEVTKPGPEKGVIRRGLTVVKGLLAPVASGARTAVSEESAEFVRTLFEGFESLPI